MNQPTELTMEAIDTFERSLQPYDLPATFRAQLLQAAGEESKDTELSAIANIIRRAESPRFEVELTEEFAAYLVQQYWKDRVAFDNLLIEQDTVGMRNQYPNLVEFMLTELTDTYDTQTKMFKHSLLQDLAREFGDYQPDVSLILSMDCGGWNGIMLAGSSVGERFIGTFGDLQSVQHDGQTYTYYRYIRKGKLPQ